MGCLGPRRSPRLEQCRLGCSVRLVSCVCADGCCMRVVSGLCVQECVCMERAYCCGVRRGPGTEGGRSHPGERALVAGPGCPTPRASRALPGVLTK